MLKSDEKSKKKKHLMGYQWLVALHTTTKLISVSITKANLTMVLDHC